MELGGAGAEAGMSDGEVATQGRRRAAPRSLPFVGIGLVAGIGLALLVLSVWQVLQPQGGASAVAVTGRAPWPGESAPDFTLQDVDGGAVRLSQFKGRPIMLNFWASWCNPCRIEMPDIERAYREHKDDGLVILGVDEQEDPVVVRQFLSQRDYTWTFLLDPDGQVGNLYRASALPTTYFIDRQGVVQTRYVGTMTIDTLRAKLASILAQ